MSRNLIDRDELLEKAKQEQRFYKDEYDAMESGYLDEEREIVKEAYTTMTDCVSLINNAPIVDAVEVKHGEWIMFERPNGGYYKGCSLCTYPMPTDMELDYLCEEDNRYCYNCGAKMDGKEQK